jgi:hypothetical protein
MGGLKAKQFAAEAHSESLVLSCGGEPPDAFAHLVKHAGTRGSSIVFAMMRTHPMIILA